MSSGAVLEQRSDSYIGQNVSVLMGALGRPEVAGRSRETGMLSYAWTYENQGTYTAPRYNSGTVYGPYGRIGTFSYTTYETRSFDHFCWLAAVANDNREIISMEIHGSNNSCLPLVSRL